MAVAAVAQAVAQAVVVAVVLGAMRVRVEEVVVVVAEWETGEGLHRVCREGRRRVK